MKIMVRVRHVEVRFTKRVSTLGGDILRAWSALLRAIWNRWVG